jgi:hypothetical protein
MEDEMSRKTDELICELKAFADLHEDSDIVREAVCQLLRLESELGLLRSHLNTTIIGINSLSDDIRKLVEK